MASDNHDEGHLVQHVTERWNELNKTLEHVPKFQNKHQTGVNEESIKELESKLKISLPKEIRAVIKVHDGRKHIGYGLGYRLPTTDLLPISQWKPYEKDNEDFADELFQCLVDKNNSCADKNLREDAREHLNAYIEGTEKAQKQNNDNKSINNEVFQSLSCELLIIGQGMDDYAEQYLLSIRSGRIYLAIHNIPEWRLIGTFADWVQKGLINAKQQNDELKEQHDEAEVS
jgi:cell wall assembly regulator SMI1